jgi:hypothetical protein
LADLETISAKYNPLPNMYPVTGASGGAIRKPYNIHILISKGKLLIQKSTLIMFFGLVSN